MPYSSSDPANYFAVGQQSARGTEASSFKFWKYGEGTGFEIDSDHESEFEGGDGQAQGLHYKTAIKADPQLTGNARPDFFTHVSAFVMGSQIAPPSVGATDLASHVFVPNATVPYLTVEQRWRAGNSIDRVTDTIVKAVEIKGEANKPWRITAEMVSGATVYLRNGAASALTAAFESNPPFMYAGGAYLIDGATSLDITNFTYKFERGVDDDLYTLSPYRRAVVPLNYAVSLDFQVIVENANLYEKVVAGAAGATQIPVALPTGAFRAQSIAGSSQMAQIDIPLLNYVGAKVNRIEPDGKTVLLDVVAMGVKGATGIVQHRSNVLAVPSQIV